VVRLKQGDPNRETEYAGDPFGVAGQWARAGVEWLHVVDLDGALGENRAPNLAALERILGATPGVQVQFGGGLRDLASIRQALELGVSRIVLGTAAVRNPALVEAVLETHGAERVAVGIDARQGRAQTHGWQEATGITALDLAHHWADRGVRWMVFTDVGRDGMGRGLNLEATVSIAEATGIRVIASGGVSSLADVHGVYDAGLSGVIIGRALYAGWVSLEEALRVGANA
jgi:phosphoribosylformimino-5-aminoimidazole carboxamide ribotide isomerase